MKIHIFKIAWNENKWKGMPEKKEDYEKNYKMADYEFVEKNGIAHEWWNFYEDFDKDYFYFTDPKSEGVKNIEDGDIVLLISTIGKKERQFVGVMGECIKLSPPKSFSVSDASDASKLSLNEEQINWIKEKNKKFPQVEYEKEVWEDFSIKYEVASKKEFSFCLEEFIPYNPYSRDIGDLRRQNHAIVNQEKYPIVIKMLEEAKEKNYNLKEKIDMIIEKIKNSSGNLSSINITEKKEIPSTHLSSILNALQTKPFLILAGVSGTGKTQIARLIAWAMSSEEENIEGKKEDKDGTKTN